jgi:gliding motility-associated-like protein
LWSTGSTSNSISINPTTDTQYTVTYTVNNCPSQPATTSVTVNPIPTITVSDVTICGGLSTTLNPVVTPTGGTYAWSTGSTGTEIIVNPSSTTPYTLSYTANGCLATKTINVTVIQNPSADLNDTTICFGQSATLVALPNGGVYSWSTTETTQSITVSPTVTSTYSVTVSVGGCAPTTATATVTVNPIPTVSIAQDQTICNGGSTTLSATGFPSGGSYLWSNGTTGATNSVSPNLAISTVQDTFPYNVIYTLNGCPSIADTGLVIVNPVPTVSIPATSSVCSGSSVTIASTVNLPGGSYLWSNNETTQDISVNPTDNTGYTVTYTLNGCSSSSATGNVVVNAIPTVTATSATICNGQTASVQASGLPSSGGTYLWSTGSTSNVISDAPTTSSTYSVTYTVNNCPSQPATANVTVNPIPTITISDVTICGGLSTTLNPVVSPTGGTYSWSTGSSGTEIIVTPSSTTPYTLSYTANGCLATKTINVTVIQNPSADLNDTTICFGQSATLVALPNGGVYSWSTTETTQSITVSPTVTSTYSVTVSVGGCAPTTATATVTVNQIPTVDASPESQSICNGQVATISSTVNPGGGNYQWQGSTVNGQTTPAISVNPVLINPLATETFNYILTYSVNGCTGVKDTVQVIVKPKPVISVNDLTICSGTSDTLEANPNLVGGQYNWSFNGSTILSGNTDSLLIVSPLANPIDQITNYYYDSWYILNGCSSDTVVSNVTVNPIPTVTVNDATICAGLSATLTATPSSTGGTFAWTGPTISGSPLTTQSITVAPILTDPELSQDFVYNVTYTDLGCTSLSVPSNVTVNPTPSINPINITICSGGSFDTIPNTLLAGNNIPTNTTYTWTYADNPDILNEANNSVSSPNISGGPLTSNINVTTVVNYTVTPTSGTSGNCVGSPFNLNITITATPTIADKIDSICSGSFPVLDFIATDVVPPGTQYSWAILFDNPLISGQTNQPTFVSDFSNQILLNNDINAQPQTLTYLVTPRSGPCPGATFQLQVTVLPAPILADDTLTICSDDNITSYTFGTPGDIIPIGTEYTWVVLPNTTITGQTSNAVPSSTFNTGILHNTSNINDTLHYVITPIASANNPPCVGEPFDFLVIVQPTPVLQNVTLAPICSGTSFSYTPVDASPVTIWPAQNGGFTWTVAPNINVTGQTSNPNDPESTLSQTLTNLTNVVQNVVYTITPYDTISGCTGSNYTVTVPVNPRPKVLDTLISVCSGQPFSVVPPNNQPNNIVPIGTSYSWPTPIDNPLGSISGESAANNQPSISQTLTNINSIICDTMFYMVIPSVGTAPGLVCIGDTFTLNVRVKPVPTLTATAESNLICPSTCTELFATPSLTVDCNGISGTYSWTPSATLSPTPPINDSVTACPTQNTTYNVTYTLDGCSVSASTTVNIVNPPNISSISALEQTICEGGCTVLTANVSPPVIPQYVYWSNGEFDYTSPFQIVVCPTDTTTYFATAYLAGCNGDTAYATVNVNTDPLISAQPTPDTTICVGGTYPLSVTLQYGAGTALYQWYFTTTGTNTGGTMISGASGSIVTNTSGYTVLYTPPAFATAGDYTYYCVITYGPNGCGSLTTAPATIHVINDPVVSISPFTSDSLCVGGTAQCLQAIVSGGIGTNSYLWNPGGAIDQTFCPPSDSAGTFNYSVIVTQTGIGCGSLPSNVVPIYIVPDPIVTILGEIEVCDGAEVPLTSTVTGGIGNINGYTWNQSQPVGSPYTLMSWNGAGGTTTPLFDDIVYQLNITQEGNGCNAVDTHFINVVPDPIVVVDYDSLVCLNTPTEFNASVIGGTGTPYFDWYQVDSLLTVGGDLIDTDDPSDSSITQTLYEAYWNFYYVALEMTGLGCDPDTSELIIVEGLDWAVADFDIQPDSLVQSLFDPTFSFINRSENATNYWWDLGECDPQLPNSGLYQTPSQYYNPTATNIIDYTYGCEPGIYSVQLVATNQGICPDTVIKQIKIKDEIVVYVPNTFTPNGDGINDLFIPIVTSYSDLGQYEFRIYDRWGEVIFESKTVGEGWDGIAGRPWPGVTGTNYPNVIPYGDPNKQRPQDGTYTWTLRARLKASSEVEDYRGHVNIIR